MAENLARAWWKATRSNGSGACVEVAVFRDGTVGVRDSKHPADGALRVGTDEWSAFLDATKAGTLDL